MATSRGSESVWAQAAPSVKQEHGLQEVLEAFPSCSPALGLLADVYAAQMQASLGKGEMDAGKAICELAGNCFRGLLIADPMRRHYWQFRLTALDAALAGNQ